jgi:hypothetical protein
MFDLGPNIMDLYVAIEVTDYSFWSIENNRNVRIQIATSSIFLLISSVGLLIILHSPSLLEQAV